ncbi:MAG: hypothetical protein EAX96_03750 [Candidatus Lokiarchaeota archaeon]|nr:hypothetical protein [Candidatus Lokiarchaeota archaeon]
MLKIRIINKTENKLEVQVYKEGHSLCAPLKEYIFEQTELVDMAGYKIYHPLKPDPSIYVKTKGKTKPEDLMINAAEKYVQTIKEFETAFQEELKKFKK